ncbi:hypothetical protein FISHEDRAFT_63374 [Fistulina hepatica ATCC 64428]|uniref:Peptidase M20 domain-containing protein 2 n=1 Tax=Fistulina hepatica ATCC 64428 TaxID=1128425 RepID=A0A0D7ANA9_9AGAR|nr:hypothetical protein FISHEDRAFT_63374 [Fistulina hepatica ATCC 64428]
MSSNFQPGCITGLFRPFHENQFWLSSEALPPYTPQVDKVSDVASTVDHVLDNIDRELRCVSLQIHSHPELGFHENFAHDTLTKFLSKYDFKITKHYLGLQTAFRAEFTHGTGGRVIGINAEMDALPNGHSCGHNLIAASGVGVAVAIKAALITHDIPGKVVVIGTPAEEGGGGKIILLERGGMKDLDAVIMCHPSQGPARAVNVGSSTARQSLDVEYFGQSAHAAEAPWEGVNALDASFIAYSAISALRQQMKPTHRVHGIVSGRDWSPNVIPDYAKMQFYVRAPTKDEMDAFTERVKACLESGALATGCRMEITYGTGYYELHQNNTLGEAFAEISESYGLTAAHEDTSASTDFGNVTHELPALHPIFAIPAEKSNHSPQFAEAAATEEAHAAMLAISKVLAVLGCKFLQDSEFASEVKSMMTFVDADRPVCDLL